MPAAPAGSAAGYVYSADLYELDASGISGPLTVVGAAIGYGWATEFPGNDFERWYHLGAVPGSPRLEWGGTEWQSKTRSGNIAASVTAFDAFPATYSYDHDGATTSGARFNDGARATVTGDGPYFDTWAVGCQVGNHVRGVHAAGSWHLANRVLSDLEYTALAREITATAPVLTAGAAA
jgi:hypothetical protein